MPPLDALAQFDLAFKNVTVAVTAFIVATHAALYADPDDALDLEKKIQQVLSDGGLRERMAAKGLQYASGFSDEVLADRLMEIYKDVLSR